MRKEKKALIRRAGGWILSGLAFLGLVAGLTKNLGPAISRWTSWLGAGALPLAFYLISLAVLVVGLLLLEPWRWWKKERAGGVFLVEVLESPKAEFLSADRTGLRMTTFPRVSVKNTGREVERVRLRLYVEGNSGWDRAFLLPWEPPELWTRGGPRRLPEQIHLQPGEETTGEVQFRIPFAEPSDKEMFCRLVLVTTDHERDVQEFKIPMTLASYLTPSPSPPASKGSEQSRPSSPESSG